MSFAARERRNDISSRLLCPLLFRTCSARCAFRSPARSGFLRSAHATDPAIEPRPRKFSRKFVEKNRFRSSFGCCGAFGKSRVTRSENSSLLRRLATTKTSKKRFGKKNIFLGFGNQFFVSFPRFWRESTILSVKINFLVKFCSRYTYSEVRATKNCEKSICASRTWPLRALSARAQVYIWGSCRAFVRGGRRSPSNIKW